MIKKISFLIFVVCLVLALLSPISVQAEQGLAILSSSTEANFPSKLSFNLSAKSDVNITDIRLQYIVDRMCYAQVTSEVYLEFVPATTIQAKWNWDMRKTGGLPPGSSVMYWWTVADAKGNKIATKPVPVRFDDTRYLWQSLTEGKVTLYWYQGKQSFAQDIMATARQVLAQLAKDTGAELRNPVKIYIYANAQDLQAAMIFPQEWTGGVAFARYGTIAIGIAPDKVDWGRRATAHELAHLVVHQMTFNPYTDLPTWLDEGLAMYAEGELEPVYITLLTSAIAKDRLISVRSLSSPFSAYAQESALAYAESYSIVQFLISKYGQSKMLELLTTFREGNSYDGALSKVYGFDMDGLNGLWRQYVMKK